tara:strand:+ start:844 stop:1302 length:459 start_codon:yes stop_codon:yes gene_type:complete
MNINNPYLYSFSHNFIHIDSGYCWPSFLPFERTNSSTLPEIVRNGKQMMSVAVECVIAKHEKELEAIERRARAEKESALRSFYRSGTCSDGARQQIMGMLIENGHQKYLDLLVNSFTARNLIGDMSPIDQQARNIEAKNRSSSIFGNSEPIW